MKTIGRSGTISSTQAPSVEPERSSKTKAAQVFPKTSRYAPVNTSVMATHHIAPFIESLVRVEVGSVLDSS